MIELSYGNNQFLVSFMCWDMFIAPFPKTAERPNKVGAQEKKTPGLQCAPTKFPFSCKFAESASSIYDIFQVTGGQGPRSHQREVLCLPIKMQKHNSGQEQHRRPQEHVREQTGIDEVDFSFLPLSRICLFLTFLLLIHKILFQVVLNPLKNVIHWRNVHIVQLICVFPEVPQIGILKYAYWDEKTA